VSKQLDSIKKSDRKTRKQSKTTPALTATDTDKNDPSSGADLHPESHRGTTVDEAPNPYTMALRIEVDHAANGEASETDGAGSNEHAARGATTEPGQEPPDRNASVQSNARVRAEEFAAENAHKKADTDRKRKAREDARIETERALAAAAISRSRAEREALTAAQARTRIEIEAARVARERARAEAEVEATARARAQQDMQLRAGIDARIAAEREAEFTALGRIEAEREAFEEAQRRREAENKLEAAAPARARAEADV